MRIAVIDDLAICREELKECLARYMDENYTGEEIVVEEYESGREFLSEFKTEDYDMIFIDQYMEGISGIETAHKIRERDDLVVIVFVTTSQEHAIDSYEVRASGYMVKPYQYEDFIRMMKLAGVEKLRNGRFIQLRNEDMKILLNEILWCDQEGHYIQIHTSSRGMLRFRMSFTEMEKMLAPYPQFLSCYRGCMVNMSRALRVDELNFVMDNGELVPFRKRYRSEIEKQFNKYLFRRLREEEML